MSLIHIGVSESGLRTKKQKCDHIKVAVSALQQVRFYQEEGGQVDGEYRVTHKLFASVGQKVQQVPLSR